MANILKFGTAVEDTAVSLLSSGWINGNFSGTIVSRDLSEFKYVVIAYTNNYSWNGINYTVCKVPTSGSLSYTFYGKVIGGGYDGRLLQRSATVWSSGVSVTTTGNAPSGDDQYASCNITNVWGLREGGMF